MATKALVSTETSRDLLSARFITPPCAHSSLHRHVVAWYAREVRTLDPKVEDRSILNSAEGRSELKSK
jgi:hypothetical protein